MILTSTTRPIPGFTGYFATTSGHIQGLRGRVLLGHQVTGGYHRTTVKGDHGGRQHRLVHVLVASAFLGPQPAGMQVNHVNGDKADNRPENLEYVTPSENVRHSIDVLDRQRAPGEANASATLTEPLVVKMRARYDAGENAAALGRAFSIDPGHAWRICTRRSWRHVGDVA